MKKSRINNSNIPGSAYRFSDPVPFAHGLYATCGELWEQTGSTPEACLETLEDWR